MYLYLRRARAAALIVIALLGTGLSAAQARAPAPLPPSELYGELYRQVEAARIFPDSKTFADAAAKTSPAEIMRRYATSRQRKEFSLRDFVSANFIVPGAAQSDFRTPPDEEIRSHIDRLWNALTREPHEPGGADSHLAMRTRYVVPGGRFREMYYWDSYFTMLGLQAGGRDDLVAAMVDNFAGLIDDYGHIPNGSRSYYLSRSQPPFFAAMVRLQASSAGPNALVQHLPQLEREYGFWMDGADRLKPGSAHRRVVRLADGSLLNRYWDDRATPRDEAWVEDVATSRGSPRPPAELYRNLRAAAESGWDFSSRWLADGKTLNTIRTTDLLPVDLNSLLYVLELTIAQGCEQAQQPDCQRDMQTRAAARRQSVQRLMWNDQQKAFVDYDWRHRQQLAQLTAATAYPLFADLASDSQAHDVATTIRASLLMPHGFATTTVDSGQQWDAPNGWAPLQWIAIDGLRRHGESELASAIAIAWVSENGRVYCRTGKLVEKYNVRDAGAGAGGEYPVQDGFGWTNGVLLKLLALYPELARRKYEFTGGACTKPP